MHVLVWTANIAGLNWLIESQPFLIVCMYAKHTYGYNKKTTLMPNLVLIEM
jgi:hypothetical protein